MEPNRKLDAHGPRARRALSISEFCHRYSIGRTRAYEEIATGRLRAVKVGRKTLIVEDSAEAWFAALPGLKGTRGVQKDVNQKARSSSGQRDA
jgi:excisionase family DNA binding protein